MLVSLKSNSAKKCFKKHVIFEVESTFSSPAASIASLLEVEANINTLFGYNFKFLVSLLTGNY